MHRWKEVDEGIPTMYKLLWCDDIYFWWTWGGVGLLVGDWATMMGQNIYHWKEVDKGNPIMYKFMVICEFLCVRSSAARLYDLSRMPGGHMTYRGCQIGHMTLSSRKYGSVASSIYTRRVWGFGPLNTRYSNIGFAPVSRIIPCPLFGRGGRRYGCHTHDVARGCNVRRRHDWSVTPRICHLWLSH